MEITVEQMLANVPVTVMKLKGELDASSYLEVIDRVKELHRQGTRNLLLDLEEMLFMASSGLVALHSIAMIMRGQEPPDPEAGWGALHAIAHEVESNAGHEAHCKLLNPQPRVARTLQVTGFANILAIYADREEALASFS